MIEDKTGFKISIAIIAILGIVFIPYYTAVQLKDYSVPNEYIFFKWFMGLLIDIAVIMILILITLLSIELYKILSKLGDDLWDKFN